jgi:hypothetical protein
MLRDEEEEPEQLGRTGKVLHYQGRDEWDLLTQSQEAPYITQEVEDEE